jgi:hypothetical protein
LGDCLLGAVKKCSYGPHFGLHFSWLILTKMSWATLWAIFHKLIWSPRLSGDDGLFLSSFLGNYRSSPHFWAAF